MSGGPFGKPLFGTPAVVPIGDNIDASSEENAAQEKATAAQPTRKFNLKQSALSSMADNMWKKSQSVFSTDQKIAPVHLEKKTLNDVLGKITAEAKEKAEEKETPKFIFGSKIKEKVSGEIPVEKGQENNEEASTAPKSSLLEEVTAESTSKFREESNNAAEALKKEQEKQLAGTSLVEVTTGEEDDQNILQAACKLHIFDKDKKIWIERGLCQFRINMREEADSQTHYRIVARTIGNQRVIINSKIFADMFLERVDAKRLKLTAMCPEFTTPQVFLLTISFSKTDLTMDALFNALNDCLKKERSDEKRKRKAPVDEELETRSQDDAFISKREKTDVSETKEQESGESPNPSSVEETGGVRHNGSGNVQHEEEDKNEIQEDMSERTDDSQDNSP